MLPKIRRNVEIRKETVDAFSFFNASPDAPYGSFRHTKNISSEAFPNVTVRKPHGQKGIEDKIMGALFADGHLLTVRAISKDECAFYVDGRL